MPLADSVLSGNADVSTLLASVEFVTARQLKKAETARGETRVLGYDQRLTSECDCALEEQPERSANRAGGMAVP